MKECYTREQIETAVKEKGYKWFEITESEYINRKKLIKSINQLS